MVWRTSCSVMGARFHSAARYGTLIMFAFVGADLVRAEDGGPLVLPLGSVASVTGTPDAPPAESRRSVGAIHIPPPRVSSGPLPSQLHIPDGYAVDIDRKTPLFAAPFDSDRIVAFDLFSRPRRGWMVSFAYDQEARRPRPGSADVIGIIFERDF